MQCQLDQIQRRRGEAEGLEVRETYEGVAVDVDVRGSHVAVANGVSKAGSLGERLARQLGGRSQELQPAAGHETLPSLDTGLHGREQGLVAGLRDFGQPGETYRERARGLGGYGREVGRAQVKARQRRRKAGDPCPGNSGHLVGRRPARTRRGRARERLASHSCASYRASARASRVSPSPILASCGKPEKPAARPATSTR